MSKGAIELLKQVAYELDAYITGGYFPNTHVLLDKVENFLARHEQEHVTPREQNELHSVPRQKGNLTQDGCWDAIEVFSQFLKKQHYGIGEADNE